MYFVNLQFIPYLERTVITKINYSIRQVNLDRLFHVIDDFNALYKICAIL